MLCIICEICLWTMMNIHIFIFKSIIKFICDIVLLYIKIWNVTTSNLVTTLFFLLTCDQWLILVLWHSHQSSKIIIDVTASPPPARLLSYETWNTLWFWNGEEAGVYIYVAAPILSSIWNGPKYEFCIFPKGQKSLSIRVQFEIYHLKCVVTPMFVSLLFHHVVCPLHVKHNQLHFFSFLQVSINQFDSGFSW